MGTAACSVEKASAIISDAGTAIQESCGCSDQSSLRDSRTIKLAGTSGVQADAPTSNKTSSKKNKGSPKTQRVQGSCGSVDAALVNQLLSFVWPKVSEYVHNVLIATVEPTAKKVLEKYGTHFRFDNNLDLGKKTPSLNKLALQQTEGDNIRGQVHFEWDPDLEFTMHFNLSKLGLPMSVSLSKLIIRGNLTFEFVGMIPEPPLFKGIRFAFVEQPEIMPTFKGKAGDLFDRVMRMDEVQERFAEVLSQRMAAQIVVPRWQGVLLHPSADFFDTICALPQGMLLLRVIEGQKLLGKDTSFFGRPVSDPYVVVVIGSMKFKSEVKYKTVDPKFDFSLSCLICDRDRQQVFMSVWDKDNLSLDDFLGKLTFKVADTATWPDTLERSIELEDSKGKPGKNGTIKMSSSWKPLVRIEDRLPEKQVNDRILLLFCGVYAAHRVPWLADDCEFWIEAKCLYSNEQQRDERDEQKSGIHKRIPRPTYSDKEKSPKALRANKQGLALCSQVAASQSLEVKLELLRRRKLTEEEIIMVLDLDEEEHRRWKDAHAEHEIPAALRELAATRRDEMVFNHSFTFVIKDSSAAMIKIDFMCTFRGNERSLNLGTHEIAMSELLETPPSSKEPRTVLLIGKHQIQLSLCLQLYSTAE